MAVSLYDALQAILNDLEAATPDIEGSLVISYDGLMMASAVRAGVDEERVAAMTAALLALGEKTAKDLARGDVEVLYVKGTEGDIVLMSAGPEAVLGSMCRKDSRLGIIFLDMRVAAKQIASVVPTP